MSTMRNCAEHSCFFTGAQIAHFAWLSIKTLVNTRGQRMGPWRGEAKINEAATKKYRFVD